MTNGILNLDIIDDILMQAMHDKLSYPSYTYLAVRHKRRIVSCETYCEAYFPITQEIARKQRGL